MSAALDIDDAAMRVAVFRRFDAGAEALEAGRLWLQAWAAGQESELMTRAQVPRRRARRLMRYAQVLDSVPGLARRAIREGWSVVWVVRSLGPLSTAELAAIAQGAACPGQADPLPKQLLDVRGRVLRVGEAMELAVARCEAVSGRPQASLAEVDAAIDAAMRQLALVMSRCRSLRRALRAVDPRLVAHIQLDGGVRG